MRVPSAAGRGLALLLVVLDVTWLGAQQPFGLDQPPAYSIVVPQFTDRQVTDLVTRLDSLLAAPTAPGRWADSARSTLTDFGRRLQLGRLTSIQERRVLDYFDRVERTFPNDSNILQAPRFTVSTLTVGKTAPDITGKDLDGKDFRLSDYRGKVVVLMFWGEWCGICRTAYPYERLLLELYKNWPFAIVGVNSDQTRDIAKQAVTANKLTYRSWWDGEGSPADPVKGPIASTWNVTGWPAVYVLDARGVIRYVDLSHEDLLKGVRQLLTEQTSSVHANSAKK